MNRTIRFWVLLVAALVVVVLLVGGSGGSGPAYDPRSVDLDGARGIVETLERLGADVELDRAVPSDGSSTALMLQDRLTVDDQAALRQWVQAGGVLVTADVGNDLAATSVGVLQPRATNTVIERDRCSIEALKDVKRLHTSGRLLDAFATDSCFGDGNRAFIVAQELGNGTVVTVGSADIFTNAGTRRGRRCRARSSLVGARSRRLQGHLHRPVARRLR